MLISAVMPIMSVYRLPQGQYGYSGHVINLPQDVASFAQSLPRLPSELDVIVVRKEGANQTHHDFRVRRGVAFRSEKYLSEPKEGASVEKMDDIGEVAEDDLPEDTVTIEGVTVAAATISEYSSCVACNSKVEPLQSNTQIAQCTKCSLQQLTTTARQHTSANLLINVGVEYMQLTAFNNILEQIVNGREISVVGLLMAPRFNMTYDGKVIVSISRPPSQ